MHATSSFSQNFSLLFIHQGEGFHSVHVNRDLTHKYHHHDLTPSHGLHCLTFRDRENEIQMKQITSAFLTEHTAVITGTLGMHPQWSGVSNLSVEICTKCLFIVSYIVSFNLCNSRLVKIFLFVMVYLRQTSKCIIQSQTLVSISDTV